MGSYYGFEESLGMGMVIYWLVYMLVIVCLGIVMYVLRSAGMYSIAKRRGINHPWMAWVPVVNYYLLGCISDQYQYVVKGRNKSKRKVMLTLNIVNTLLLLAMVVCYAVVIGNLVAAIINSAAEEEMLMGIMAPLIGVLGLCIPVLGISIALAVFWYMAMYDLYNSCCPQNSVMFLVLSIIINVTEPFFIFFNRKKDDGMPPRRPEPQAYIPEQPQYQPPQEPWENPDKQ